MANIQPLTLIYGRTAGGVNVPVLVDDDGKIVTTGGSPNPFDQDLNTDDNVSFNQVTLPFTATRVVFAGASGVLSTDAGLVYNSTTDTLTAGTFIPVTTYKSVDGSSGVAAASITSGDLVGKTITVKNGLIVGYA